MILSILRHGEADALGNLTPDGSKAVASVLYLAKGLGLCVTSILSSPLPRARQSALVAREVFGVDCVVTNALEPEGSPDGIYEELKGRDSVLLVSHKPLVSRFLSDVLGAETGVEFSPGTLAVVSGIPETGGCVLTLLIPPRI